LKVWENGNEFCHHCGYDNTKDKAEWVPSPEYKPCKKPKQELPQTVSAEFREVMADRCISHETIQRNKISWNGREIMFPYFYNGEIFNIKYRDLNKKFRQEAGALKGFYGLDDIVGKKVIYIVEGEFDKLACEEAGYLAVVSVPDGAPSVNAKEFTTKFEFIDNFIEVFEQAEKIIIAVDNDLPGKKLEKELIRRFDPERCWTVTWPDGCKDANQCLVDHGILPLMGCLDAAEQVPISGIFEMGVFKDEYFDLYDNGLKGGESTGWREMDEQYTVRLGDLCIITGVPSHGKTTWLNALLVNLANLHGWKFGIFTPENEPLSRFSALISQLKIGKPFRRGITERMTKEEAAEGFAWAEKYFYFLKPTYKERTVSCLIEKTKTLVRRYGISGVVFDPWNLITKDRISGQSETEHILVSLEAFKAFAREYNVTVWIVAHPSKPLREPGSDKLKVVGAYDISGSAHWYNIADDILSVWRDPPNPKTPAQVHVIKVRFEEVGTAGKHVDFDFNRAVGSFSVARNAIDVTETRYVDSNIAPKQETHFKDSYNFGQKEFKA
jgi:twinkle protein